MIIKGDSHFLSDCHLKLLFHRHNDLGCLVVAVELGHHVNAARPGFDLLNQLDGEFHTDFRGAIFCRFDACAGFFGDDDAGDFMV